MTMHACAIILMHSTISYWYGLLECVHVLYFITMHQVY